MVAVVLGLAAGCCFGWADFLGDLASRRGARTVVLGGQALSLVLLAVPLALTGDSLHGGAVVFGGLAGVAGTFGLLALFRAMELGTMGTASPIAAVGAAVPVVAGLAAGERPAVAALVGIPLALAGDRRVGVGDRPRTRDPVSGCRDRRRTHRRRRPDRGGVIRQERSRSSRTAQAATSVRDDIPSLARMFDTWTAAVRGEM
jgi:uncharacterized membrane protein